MTSDQATREESPVLEVGQEVAPGYLVVDHLRRGQDLDSYEVFSTARRASCIVKTVRPDRGHREKARARLVREGELLLSFTHPHVVRAYELVETRDGLPALVMETLGGLTVGGLLERTPRLVASDLGHLGVQLSSAVGYLHDHGVLHLDIKPSNVICDEGRVRLIDLSLARPPGTYHRGVGTAAYLAPEQARGGHLDTPADVWGVGLLVYEAATGTSPFEAPTASSVSRSDPAETTEDRVRRHPQLVRRAEPVRRLRRLPAPVAGTIDASLSPEPADRPTLEELATALATLCGPGLFPEGWWVPAA